MSRVTFRKGAKVARIQSHLENPTRALKQIGVLMVAESQSNFRRQTFGLNKWEPRAPVNVFGIIADFAQGRRKPPARRFQRRPALRDTGRLAASIAFRVIGKNIVEVGTNLPYAQVHQTGGKTKSEPITGDVRQRLWRWLRTQSLELKRRLGWILNKKFKGKHIEGTVPKRQFIGITSQTRKTIRKAIGVYIMEVR